MCAKQAATCRADIKSKTLGKAGTAAAQEVQPRNKTIQELEMNAKEIDAHTLETFPNGLSSHIDLVPDLEYVIDFQLLSWLILSNLFRICQLWSISEKLITLQQMFLRAGYDSELHHNRIQSPCTAMHVTDCDIVCGHLARVTQQNRPSVLVFFPVRIPQDIQTTREFAHPPA